MPESSNAPAPRSAASPADSEQRVLLGMLHSARDRGDGAEAERLWLRILVAELERVRGLVGAYRHPDLTDGRILASDVDDVAHDVFVRLHAKSDTLRGRSVGELRNFMRTATEFACLDYLDRHVRDRQRRAGSLDAAPSEPGASTADDALAHLAERLAADDEAAEVARQVVHPALGLVDDDKRVVLVMDQAGYSVSEIMERLEISRDAVYQRRKRGLRQLTAAIRELAEEDGDR